MYNITEFNYFFLFLMQTIVTFLGFEPTETFFEIDSSVNCSVGKMWVVTRHYKQLSLHMCISNLCVYTSVDILPKYTNFRNNFLKIREFMYGFLNNLFSHNNSKFCVQ